MMTIRQHRIARWVYPALIVIAGFPLAIRAVRMFPEIESIGSFVLFGAILAGMLVAFLLQFAAVKCPNCQEKLEYYSAKHSKMSRYTCATCGYKDKN